MAGSAAIMAAKSSPSSPAMPPLACNIYPWITFLRRDGLDLDAHLATVVTDIANAGFQSVEPILDTRDTVETYAPLLADTGITMESAYMNSVLHDETAAASIDHVVRVATYAQETLGTRMLVTNPSPLSWGGPENKSDEQIRLQGQSLNQLGAALRSEGITLAYHNHDSELRLGAREFHHMLVSTDPANVKFCLDAHWIYRGCDDSSIALFDVLELYADRIVELHLRQSTGGVWDETFSADRDIDYPRLFDILSARGVQPLLTLEQAVEDNSPHEHDGNSAHRASRAALAAMLA